MNSAFDARQLVSSEVIIQVFTSTSVNNGKKGITLLQIESKLLITWFCQRFSYRYF